MATPLRWRSEMLPELNRLNEKWPDWTPAEELRFSRLNGALTRHLRGVHRVRVSRRGGVALAVLKLRVRRGMATGLARLVSAA